MGHNKLYKYVKTFRQTLKSNLVYVHGEKCSICGYNKCLSALEFHHLDSEEKEFNLSNNSNIATEKALAESKKCILVCANCHREIHSNLIDTKLLVSSFVPDRASQILNSLHKHKHKENHICQDCGIAISDIRASRCVACANLNKRVVSRPSRDELKNQIRSTSFVDLGKKYHVSDKTISNWCKAENLPNKKAEIKIYSDEEWEKL